MKLFTSACFIIIFSLVAVFGYGQQNTNPKPARCGTMEAVALKWQKNPALKQQFETERNRFNKAVKEGAYRLSSMQNQLNGNGSGVVTIPVIFHVVLGNQSLVTDAQIQAQIDTLNKDYAGVNGDSVVVPSYFKSVFGHSGLQFCLAKQTADGVPTTGIERTNSSTSVFYGSDNGVKHSSAGGADSWGTTSYLNVWICGNLRSDPVFNDQLLGYSTLPSDSVPHNEEGVVIDYTSLPGATLYPAYDQGKTLTHEIGHYFFLFHPWGPKSDNPNCTETDGASDTPVQDTATYGFWTGIRYDKCTPSGNGIMYQNYMEYTDDTCLVMFTNQQVAIMESALVAYHFSLLTSKGCQSPFLYNLDAQLKSVNQPLGRACNSSFSPDITIRNYGNQALTQLTITTVLDNNSTSTTSWTGNLATFAYTNISLHSITAALGSHTLKVYLSNPNNSADQNTVNDTLTISFQYNNPVTSLAEGFEGTLFPPAGWDIVNPDSAITWKKTAVAAKTGSASVMIDNFDYTATGQQDYLRLPGIILPSVDSVFLSFQVAAAAYTDTSTTGNTWDTLEVVASTDCGQTYTSLYKKWGGKLVTHAAPLTTAYVLPAANEWRKDSINISNYIGKGNVLFAFRNTTGHENNIYIDDVNLRTVSINPNLRSAGILVTPNPTAGVIAVQFYPQPKNVNSIAVFNMSGQKVAEIIPKSQLNYYSIDLSRNAAGIYIVRVVIANQVVTRKIFKY